MKKALFIALAAFIALTSAACSRGQERTGDGGLTVSVTIDAVYEFTKAIAGDRATINKIVPDGASAHDFEPKARDVEGIADSGLIVTVGLGMEPWLKKIQSENSGLFVIEASSGVTPIYVDEETHGDEHEHSEYDPHMWLSLSCAAEMVSNIKDALCELSPENKVFFDENCRIYLEQLDDLHNEYAQKFDALKKKDFVTSHAAFSYMCRDYGLVQNSVSGVFSEGEPNARKIAELTDFCKENGITVIFAEYGESPRLQETLARQTGARVETLYTIEMPEDGRDYIERMSHNLSVIYGSFN